MDQGEPSTGVIGRIRIHPRSRDVPSVRRIALTLVLLASIAAGCSTESASPAPGAQATLAYDSSGVRIVTHGEQALAGTPLWMIADTPQLVVGEQIGDEPYELFGVVAARILSDGGVTIAETTGPSLRFYGADGAFRFRYGRRGDGPDEFRSLQSVVMLDPEALLIWDPRSARLTRFNASNGESDFMRLEDEGSRIPPHLVGAFADGSYVLQHALPIRSLLGQGREARDSLRYLVYGHRDRRGTALTRSRGGEFFVLESEGMRGSQPVIFGRTTHAAIGGGTTLLLAEDDAQEIRAYAPTGELVSIIRFDVRTRSVDEQDARSVPDLIRRPAVLAEAPTEVQRFLRATSGEIVYRRSLPLFAGLAAGFDGDVWMSRHPHPSDTEVEWLALDPDGMLVRRLAVPKHASVLDFGTSHILLLIKDELGVERVELRAIEPASLDDRPHG
jgi:hypothetical protein